MAEETEWERRQRRISSLRADIYGIADAAITYSILNIPQSKTVKYNQKIFEARV